MRVPKTISAHWLRKHGACESSVTRFISIFGKKSFLITWEVLRKACHYGFDVHFFLNRYDLCGGTKATCPSSSRELFRRVFGR